MMTQENINKEKNDTTNRTLLCVRYLNEFESAAKIVKFIYVHLRVWACVCFMFFFSIACVHINFCLLCLWRSWICRCEDYRSNKDNACNGREWNKARGKHTNTHLLVHKKIILVKIVEIVCQFSSRKTHEIIITSNFSPFGLWLHTSHSLSVPLFVFVSWFELKLTVIGSILVFLWSRVCNFDFLFQYSIARNDPISISILISIYILMWLLVPWPF